MKTMIKSLSKRTKIFIVLMLMITIYIGYIYYNFHQKTQKQIDLDYLLEHSPELSKLNNIKSDDWVNLFTFSDNELSQLQQQALDDRDAAFKLTNYYEYSVRQLDEALKWRIILADFGQEDDNIGLINTYIREKSTNKTDNFQKAQERIEFALKKGYIKEDIAQELTEELNYYKKIELNKKQ